MIEGSTKRGIYEVNFGYNVKMGVYANSSSDISMLSKIAFNKRVKERGIKELKINIET